MVPVKDAEVRDEQEEQTEIERWMYRSLRHGSLELWHAVWQA